MSDCSDDTDVLLLIPPDLYVVPDSNEVQGCVTESLVNHVQYLEDKIYQLETNFAAKSMRRFGSVDVLTPTSRSLHYPRSLQTTPLKLNNMLHTEPYISQKHRDDKMLREIDDYFKQRYINNDDVTNSNQALDASEVKNILSEVEQTQIAVLGKFPINDGISDTQRSEECSNKTLNVRRSLVFDSPNKKDESMHEAVDLEIHVDREMEKTLPFQKATEYSQKQSFCASSLNNQWSDNVKQSTYEELQVLRQRIEEERCRRRHCEGIISDLQKSLLQVEEKLAVAVRTEQEKDIAIRKLREGWLKVMDHWKTVDSQQSELSAKINEERGKFSEERELLNASVKRYELELSKALDLAHGYKEKCEAVLKEQKAAIREKESMRLNLEEAQDQIHILEESNANLKDLIAEKEESLNQTHAKVSELSVQIRDLKKQLKSGQNDKERLQQERSAKATVQSKLDEALKRESVLQEQIRTATKNKTDLKQYYQEQVERIVNDKQKEFQAQLLTAEKTLQKQLEGKERAVEELARQQVQQIVDKHKLEVSLIEEKHCQEIKLYEIRIAQSNDKIEDLQKIICERTSYQQELAEKLHNVMETQWKETLKVITTTKPLNQDNENSSKPALLRENTFTLKGENKNEPEAAPFCRDAVRQQGCVTYRVNETPQKIPPEPKLRDYIEQLLFEQGRLPVQRASQCLEHSVCFKQCANSDTSSSSGKYVSTSSKPHWK